MFGEDAALGYYHDYSGYVIVLIAIGLIFKTGNIIEKGFRLSTSDPENPEP